MILFMVPNTQKPESDGRFLIQLAYDGIKYGSIKENNFHFISWNEIWYVDFLTEKPKKIPVYDIKSLMSAVFYAVKCDPFCQNIAAQFYSQYQIDICQEWENESEFYENVILKLFQSWAHPMIGNLALSPHIRPQQSEEQYVNNWESFPGNYMDQATRDYVIKEMIHDPASVGLPELTRSGRDQVRVCKDFIELARAVMGEISTYATKKLEKIYALELCHSQSLQTAQKRLVKMIINIKKDCMYGLFMSKSKSRPFQNTEYLHFYFPGIVMLKAELQWTAFVYFIDNMLGDEGPSGLIINEKPSGKDYTLINECIKQFEKFPFIIRGAMIIDAIKRLEPASIADRYSIEVNDVGELNGSSDFLLKCHVARAAGKSFVPKISKNNDFLLWNLNRNERHSTTMTYRHYLLPLWAGPSGHAIGITYYYIKYLGRNKIHYITIDGKTVSIAAIILASLFSFWRLYYDKRISAVHTLTETFEAAFTFGIDIDKDDIDTINYILNLSLSKIANDLTEVYDDAFDTLTSDYIESQLPNRDGYVHPAYIMAQIRKKYYPANYKDDPMGALAALDKIIEEQKNLLIDCGFEVPQWSKPIKRLEAKDDYAEYTEYFKGAVVRNFSVLNVSSLVKPQIMPAVNSYALFGHNVVSTERLEQLYQKLSALTVAYNFSEDFPFLSVYAIGDEKLYYLSELVFSDIRDCQLNDTELTFTATVSTNADFWDSVKSLSPLKEQENICCMVTDNEEGINFAGCVEVNSCYQITDKLSVNIAHIILESGLDENSSFPRIIADAKIVGKDDKLDLSMAISLGSNFVAVNGEYQDGKVFTISKLLSVLGMDGIIPISSILPDDESIFGSLGLRDISMTVLTDTVSLTHVDFTITAEKPWHIYDDKITLQPYFKVNIEYPFDSEKRDADYVALGKWTIGKTVFDLIYRSDKVINVKLAEDSVLNFEDVANLFAEGIKFPKIKLTEMELTADMVSKNYFLCLEAEDVLEFDVGKASIGINDISFELDFRDGKFGDLILGGTFMLGGLSLHLSGVYNADDVWFFEAEAFSDTDYSLGDFVKQIAADLSGEYDPKSFPDDFLTVNIRLFNVSWKSENSEFHADVSLENILKIGDSFSIDTFSLETEAAKDTALSFKITAAVTVCKAVVSLLVSKTADSDFVISGTADMKDLTFGDIANDLGINTDNLPAFIAEFSITGLTLKYNITKKEFSIDAVTSAGTIAARLKSGNESSWDISYETPPSASIDMLNMPLVGELVKKISPTISDFSVKDFKIDASSVNGVTFRCTAFGNTYQIDIYKPDKSVQADLIARSIGDSDIIYSADTANTVKWLKLNKTFAILTIPKVGIGLDQSRAVLLLDASLDVSPFSFGLMGAGVGINLSKPSDIVFYISGFEVSFDNGTLSIGGGFTKSQKNNKTVYAGSLMVKFKSVSAVAIGEYSSGSMIAYLVISAAIGGPPAFFITGLAAGFGYNKKLTLPSVEDVPKYPLITAATKGFDDQILEDLNKWISDESKQNFFTAGIKFNSFKMVNGFMLLSVSFGNNFEIGALGLADITVPPNIESNPIAKAQLALKAVYNQSAGVFSVEARLTSESYILSKDCKLTGGFAAYFWFDKSEYSGDFVITLGGYHPAFRKPAHYPSVPRLGLNWNINSNLNISGEIYFALTPSTLMAGGKLSAVYSSGKLRAWFTAYADFLICWRPFSYRAEIGVSIGASYRVDVWFIHKTFSIELSANLSLWGPEVQGKLHVTWFIISFTISFSKGKDYSEKALNWKEFKDAFLLDSSANQNSGDSNDNSDILTFSLDGVIGKTSEGIDVVDAGTLAITLSSKIPISGNVRPVNNETLKSEIDLKVTGSDGSDIGNRFKKSDVKKNLPAAMWKSSSENVLNEESVVKDAVCGISYCLNADLAPSGLFPKTAYISLDELYKNNTLEFDDCFCFVPDVRMKLSEEDSINRFSKEADSEDTAKRRQKFLADNGITESVSMSLFAKDAQNLLSEDILIKS